MNKLTQGKRVQIIAALIAGNSIRATCHMTDVAKGTVLKLLVDLGKVSARYQGRVTDKEVEIWARRLKDGRYVAQSEPRFH